MTPAAVREAQAGGALLVDTRPIATYAAAHLPCALPIEFNLADLSERAALLLPPGHTLVVHAEPDSTIAPSVGLLEDAGFRVAGHLDGGLAAWRTGGQATARLEVLAVETLRGSGAAWHILDVREPYEYRHGHLDGATLLPSGEAFARIAAAEWVAANDGRPYAVLCSGWGRAAFVAGLLRARAIPAVLVAGGMYAWVERGYPVVSGGD